MREFRIFAEIPDGKGKYFEEEFEYLCQDTYPDKIDLQHFVSLAKDLFPDVRTVQIYELQEELIIKEKKK